MEYSIVTIRKVFSFTERYVIVQTDKLDYIDAILEMGEYTDGIVDLDSLFPDNADVQIVDIQLKENEDE